MGMYTEIWFRAELTEDAPVSFIRDVSQGSWFYGDTPDHILFKTERWRMVFGGSSYYFPDQLGVSLKHDERYGYDTLVIHASLKNYEDEIDAFFDWIDPYVEMQPGEFLGYSLYEEGDTPILYFKK